MASIKSVHQNWNELEFMFERQKIFYTLYWHCSLIPFMSKSPTRMPHAACNICSPEIKVNLSIASKVLDRRRLTWWPENVCSHDLRMCNFCIFIFEKIFVNHYPYFVQAQTSLADTSKKYLIHCNIWGMEVKEAIYLLYLWW